MPVDGCFEIRPRIAADHRGKFIKLFHSETFLKHGLVSEFATVTYAISNKHVLRGLYIQDLRHASTLLTSCTQGSVVVVTVDLRRNSKTFRKIHSTEMSASKGNMLYIPTGVAHGHLSLEDRSVFLSMGTTKADAPETRGIHWQSIDFTWPVPTPIVSDEDQGLTHLDDYQSPF